ncbi:hypothetical protein NFI96_022321 [Prochilodus magdalenae]|nr:hypothetical protein NFI96_022321 [Prochilodus magdalenae]
MKLHVLCGVLYAVSKEALAGLQLKGTVNEPISISCHHSWASTNIKYFCTWRCKDRDVLIRSKGVGTIAKKGRYSLQDRGEGRITVTIAGLKKSDTGRYWCGVERSGLDTFEEVSLKVLDGPQVTTPPQTSPATVFGQNFSSGENMDIVISSEACLPSDSHEPATSEDNTVQQETSPGDQNSGDVCPIYQNVEPSINQPNPVYQTATLESQLLYDSLPSRPNRSVQTENKPKTSQAKSK